MTIDQAIKLAQMEPRSDAAADERPSIEEVRERLEKTMRNLGLLDERNKQGWSYDEEYDAPVPPG